MSSNSAKESLMVCLGEVMFLEKKICESLEKSSSLSSSKLKLK